MWTPLGKQFRRSLAAVLPVAFLAAACAHRTRIETNPPGASVFVHGSFVCNTPCLYSSPATQLQEGAPLRLERPGYASVDTRLQTAILPSRIVGGLFTIGLVPLFKWPHTYHTLHEFQLRPLTRDERLAELEVQKRSGVITSEEYGRLRMQALGAK